MHQTIILEMPGAGAPFLASAQDEVSRVPEQVYRYLKLLCEIALANYCCVHHFSQYCKEAFCSGIGNPTQ